MDKMKTLLTVFIISPYIQFVKILKLNFQIYFCLSSSIKFLIASIATLMATSVS